jgi:hypothetical protein
MNTKKEGIAWEEMKRRDRFNKISQFIQWESFGHFTSLIRPIGLFFYDVAEKVALRCAISY